MFLAQAEIPIPGTVIQYGMAGAVIIVVFMFLKYLERERSTRNEEREQDRVDRRAERESFVKSIEAMSTESAVAAKDVSTSLRALCLRIEHCPRNRTNGRSSSANSEDGG